MMTLQTLTNHIMALFNPYRFTTFTKQTEWDAHHSRQQLRSRMVNSDRCTNTTVFPSPGAVSYIL